MMKKHSCKQPNNGGFSLVELIIVIAIMAILAASIAPAVIRYIQKSREAKAISEAEGFVNATQSAFADISSKDFNVNLNSTFTKSNGKTVRCGVVTNGILKKAQVGGVTETSPDYPEYMLAIGILDNMNMGNRDDFQFRNFAGSGSQPIGQSLASFNNKNCPGIIIVYNDHEQVIMMEYYKGNILVHYEDGEYKISESTSFTGTDRITYNQ